jgi:hypothetical protein
LLKRIDKVGLSADLVGVFAVALFFPTLVERMRVQSTFNVLLILPAYIFFCIAVYLIRKLEPAPGQGIIPQAWVQPLPMRILAILFGAALVILLLDQFRYWDLVFIVDDRELGAGESSAFFVYGPGAWLGAALFYVLVLSASVQVTIRRASRRYLPLTFLSLLFINGMVIVGTAVMATALQRRQLSPAAQGLILLLSAVCFWGPPRVWYLRKRPSLLPILSYLTFTLLALAAALR